MIVSAGMNHDGLRMGDLEVSRVIVVGGGAAGSLAAIFAARNGREVYLLEKNEKIGKKLYITGKGRCNLTNAGDMEELFAAVASNPKFLYSAFYSFTNWQAMGFFENLGVALKTERGNRVFPVSDHSSDIIRALQKELERLKVHVRFHTAVAEILTEDGRFRGVRLKNEDILTGDACIVATGGLSYPSTGATGDGYRFARKVGHEVVETAPALVPMNVREDYAKELQGLSLKNVSASIYDGKKKLFEEFGEMLFTHFGVSGPLMIGASSVVGRALTKKELTLRIDLKPALSKEQLDQRILRDFGQNKNKKFKNVLDGLFPAKLRPIMIERSEIAPDKPINDISREERTRLVNLVKNFEMTLTGLRGYDEAVITKGGVCVKEVNPQTMESKRVKGLYFAGEVLDLDARTGGFNLQIAWSTGYLAGMHAGG